MIFKKQIESFLERKIEKTMRTKRLTFSKKRKDVTFSLWWHIGRNVQNREKFDFVCMKMSHFYDKHPENLFWCGITEIVVLCDTIFVYLQRPGIMIGKAGGCIDEFERTINNIDEPELKKFNYKISLIEDRVSGEATIKSYQRL